MVCTREFFTAWGFQPNPQKGSFATEVSLNPLVDHLVWPLFSITVGVF
jgi:hypothetical protein